jgi:hypothetical protein
MSISNQQVGIQTNKNMNLIEMGKIQYGISSQLAKRDTTHM